MSVAGMLVAPGPILLVEDNPDDIALTLRAFDKNGITNRVVIAHDGVEALEHLLPADDATRLRPLLVLLDLKLPRVDGLEVLRQVREDSRTRLQPIVVLTSSREERDRAESYSRGANSYVAKPVDFVEFVEAVRVLGIYWLSLNVPPPPSAG